MQCNQSETSFNLETESYLLQTRWSSHVCYRPRIVTTDGNLVFQTGANHNISFKSSTGGSVNIDGTNVRDMSAKVRCADSGRTAFRTQSRYVLDWDLADISLLWQEFYMIWNILNNFYSCALALVPMGNNSNSTTGFAVDEAATLHNWLLDYESASELTAACTQLLRSYVIVKFQPLLHKLQTANEIFGEDFGETIDKLM